jgi:hypothetical protein
VNNSPSSLSFIVIFGVSLLLLSFVDNILMSSFLGSIAKRQSAFNLYGFMSIAFVSITVQILIFYSIRKDYTSFQIRITSYSGFFQILAIMSICINIILLSLLAVQLLSQKSYDSWIFKSIIFSSYSFSLIYIGFLIHNFLSWFRKNRNLIMFLYCLGFTIFVINEMCSILILNIQLEGRPQKISFVSNPWDLTSLRISSFSDFYKFSSILSFTITWLATSLLMYHYSKKIGKRKFWLLVSLPLIYYAGNIDIIRTSIFSYFIFSSPYLVWILQMLLGGVKQVGGFFFALVFIILARNVESQKLKFYLAISATGMMLLFSSNQISLIQIIPYPPFGLTTISLLSISSFLILTGLVGLAYSIAHDKKLLESVRNVVKENASRFLYDIGSSQWQKDIDSTVTTIMSSKLIGDYENVPTSLTEEEIKRYIVDISEEFNREKT